MAVPQLDTGQIVGPAMQQAEQIKNSRQARSIRQVAAGQQQQLNEQAITRGKSGDARSKVLEGRQDETYNYQKMQRDLKTGLASLPLVQDAAQYGEWRDWMINKQGVDENQLPALREGLTPKQFKDFKREFITAAGEKAAQMGLEEYKYNRQMQLEGQRFAKQLEIEDIRLQQAIARTKAAGGKVISADKRYEIYQNEHANYMAENGLIRYDESGKPIGYKRKLTKEDRAIIADRAKEKILFAEDASGQATSELDQLLAEEEQAAQGQAANQ